MNFVQTLPDKRIKSNPKMYCLNHHRNSQTSSWFIINCFVHWVTKCQSYCHHCKSKAKTSANMNSRYIRPKPSTEKMFSPGCRRKTTRTNLIYTHATDSKSCRPNSRTRSTGNGRYLFLRRKSNKLGPSLSQTCWHHLSSSKKGFNTHHTITQWSS